MRIRTITALAVAVAALAGAGTASAATFGAHVGADTLPAVSVNGSLLPVFGAATITAISPEMVPPEPSAAPLFTKSPPLPICA